MDESTISQAQVEVAREKTKQDGIVGVGWTAGLSFLFGVIALSNSPTWPVAAGVAALALMVAVICRVILKR